MPNRFRLPRHECNWGQQICNVGKNEATNGCGVEAIKSLVNRMKSFSNAQCEFCNLLQWTFCNGYSRGPGSLSYLEISWVPSGPNGVQALVGAFTLSGAQLNPVEPCQDVKRWTNQVLFAYLAISRTASTAIWRFASRNIGWTGKQESHETIQLVGHC